MKKRLDLKCVELKLFDSREKAKRAIMAGEVMVNGDVVCDSSCAVEEDDEIEIRSARFPYVSRGGLKLKSAVDYFKIDLLNKVCLDIGVSTGGFSHCMLMEGASKVYGVDVGRGQVHEKVSGDRRFVFIPQTNARYLKPEMFEDKIEFAAVDVSFISLKLIIPSLFECVGEECGIVFLVKPQFELEPRDLKKGIVRSEELRQKAIGEILSFISALECKTRIYGHIDCPVKGMKGNREFLLYLKKLR